MMRRLQVSITATAVLLFAGLFTRSSCDLLDPSPEAQVLDPERVDCDDPTATFTGEEIYTCECAECHGVDGKPVTPDISDIRDWDDRPRFNQSLNIGPAGMPRYPNLGAEERARLFEYVRDELGG